MGVNSIRADKLSAIVSRILNQKEVFVSGRFLVLFDDIHQHPFDSISLGCFVSFVGILHVKLLPVTFYWPTKSKTASKNKMKTN